MAEVTVTVKCITCGKLREVKAGEIPEGDTPCCDLCGMVMLAVKAEAL